jgi:hypothetical protein
MGRRKVGRLIEEQLMDCHSPDRARRLAAGPLVLSDELRREDRRALDNAVFELLGVGDPAERTQFVQRLHEETAKHFRAIRVVEIEKMEQRSQSANRRFSVQELAADAWDAAELPDLTPLVEWVGKRPECTSAMNIPEERPAVISPSPMFDPNSVYFGRGLSSHMDCRSLGVARLVVFLANWGVSGWVKAPVDDEGCNKLLREASNRLQDARSRFEDLSGSRISDEQIQAQMVDQLMRWFVHGRQERQPIPDSDADE